MRSMPRDSNAAMVARAGAPPCPHTTVGISSSRRCTMITASPPMPFMCGSTTCCTKAVDTAASNALPPRSSTDMPTADAIQCVLATAPNVPTISGRVVKVMAWQATSMTAVLTEIRDRVLIITLNRPEVRNAVNGDIAAGVEAAMDQLEENDDLLIGVITGNGPVFCAGADLKVLSQ